MNRVLTEEYLKSKTKKDKLENIRTLNLKQCNIENITILSSLCNIKILCLNDNYIKTLSPFNKTTNIEELYIRNNLIEQMKEIISAEAGVLNIDDIRTRLFGAKIYVDIEISADGNLSLNEAHTIAERVHDSIEANFADVKHCMVHVNPITI